MMYQEKFVVVVKDARGRILREKDASVYLPFGSEYSLGLKNLNSKRAVVKISIDGQDVLESNSLLIEPNSETELKGFLKGSTIKNAFKFIEKTDRISKHRGDKIDDGLIRVEIWYEVPEVYHSIYLYPTWCCPKCRKHPCKCYPNYWYSSGSTSYTVTSNTTYCNHVQTQGFDEGITVKGSEQNQRVHQTSAGTLENTSTVIVLRLRGVSKEVKVEKPITTKTKLKCSTCGFKNRSGNKYCYNCGTALL